MCSNGPKLVVRFGKDVVNGWLEAEAFTLAASLAYYAIFSIAPLLQIAIHIASLFLDRTAVVEGLNRLRRLAPRRTR
jgi:uncharacterized BrkB/YihY/UPF0761 family membrane protein